MKGVAATALVVAVLSAGACALSRAGSRSEQGTGGSTGALGGELAVGGSPLGVGGGATLGPGGQGGANDGGSAPTYGYRMPITIVANGALAAGHQLYLDLNHGKLVLERKALESGDDLRVLRHTATGFVEMERVLDGASSWNDGATRIWFALDEAMVGGTSDTSYALYYGDPDAGAPPADPKLVFDFWDGFDGVALDSNDWSTVAMGNMASSTSIEVDGGVLRITGSTEEIGPSVDDHVFVYRSVSGPFVAEAWTVAQGGIFGPLPHIGGVMVRTSLVQNGSMRVIAPTDAVDAFSQQLAFYDNVRLQGGTPMIEASSLGTPTLPALLQVSRNGATTSSYWATATMSDTVQGAMEFALDPADPLFVGISFSNDDFTNDAWVEVDWFRLRKHAQPLPGLTLGAEEPSDF